MKKNISLLAAILMTGLALVACKQEKKESGVSPSETKSAAITTAPTISGTTIGIQECDDYINKYEKCVADKVPEIAKIPLKEAFEKTRTEWKTLADSPEGKQGLSMACKMASDAAKQSMSAYGCDM